LQVIIDTFPDYCKVPSRQVARDVNLVPSEGPWANRICPWIWAVSNRNLIAWVLGIWVRSAVEVNSPDMHDWSHINCCKLLVSTCDCNYCSQFGSFRTQLIISIDHIRWRPSNTIVMGVTNINIFLEQYITKFGFIFSYDSAGDVCCNIWSRERDLSDTFNVIISFDGISRDLIEFSITSPTFYVGLQLIIFIDSNSKDIRYSIVPCSEDQVITNTEFYNIWPSPRRRKKGVHRHVVSELNLAGSSHSREREGFREHSRHRKGSNYTEGS